jgi:ribosomal protein S12 methylthiotransferase accessory factor
MTAPVRDGIDMDVAIRLPRYTPVAETLRKAQRLVDEETGIIRLLYEAPIAPDAPRIFGCAALCSEHARLGLPADNDVSGSTGLSREQAIAGAVGEAVERYSAAHVPIEAIRFATYESVADDAVAPWSLVFYEDEQYARPGFGYRAVGAEDRIGWVTGQSLMQDRAVLVPAFAVYQPYRGTPDEWPVVQQITTGLACGNTAEEAILSALCEVVERDAAMLMWLQTRRPPIMPTGSDAPAAALDVLERFGEIARHVTLLDVTSDIAIPAYVAVWDGPISDQDGAIFASCAKPDQGRAAAGALLELAQCMMWVSSLVDGGARLPHPATAAISTIEEHVLWPLSRANRSAFEFALSGTRTGSWGQSAEEAEPNVLDTLMRCVERVAAAGLEVIAVDVTSPDIADVGLHVFRAVIPGTQPLYFGSGYHRLSRRARDCPYPERAQRGINLYPHPFP